MCQKPLRYLFFSNIQGTFGKRGQLLLLHKTPHISKSALQSVVAAPFSSKAGLAAVVGSIPG